MTTPPVVRTVPHKTTGFTRCETVLPCLALDINNLATHAQPFTTHYRFIATNHSSSGNAHQQPRTTAPRPVSRTGRQPPAGARRQAREGEEQRAAPARRRQGGVGTSQQQQQHGRPRAPPLLPPAAATTTTTTAAGPAAANTTAALVLRLAGAAPTVRGCVHRSARAPARTGWCLVGRGGSEEEQTGGRSLLLMLTTSSKQPTRCLLLCASTITQPLLVKSTSGRAASTPPAL